MSVPSLSKSFRRMKKTPEGADAGKRQMRVTLAAGASMSVTVVVLGA